MTGKIYSGVHWQIAEKLVPPKGLENPTLGTPLQGHKKAFASNKRIKVFFYLYMYNVSTDNLFCSGFERKKN